MTTQELRKYFNDTFGLEDWPKSFEVDKQTYANCCQEIFNWHVEHGNMAIDTRGYQFIRITLGPNNGILFKNVELISK